MLKFLKIIYFWLPSLLWMALIFYLSSFHKLQASPVSWQDFLIRKTAHFLEYAILFLLYFRGLKGTVKLPIKKIIIFAFLATIIYAASDEYHQTKVNGRTGRILDIFIDSLGALFGVFLIKHLPEKLKKKLLF